MAGSGVIKTRREVFALVSARVDHLWRPPPGRNTFLLWDDRYYIPSTREARNMAAAACADLPSYSQDDFDCDDFAFYARGRAGAYAARQRWSNAGVCAGLFDAECAWAGGERHMACWLLYRNDAGRYVFRLVDPQDYQRVDPANRYPTHGVDELRMLAAIIG